MKIKNTLNKLIKSVRTSNMLFQNPSNELEKFNCFIKETRIFPTSEEIKGLKRHQRNWFKQCFRGPVTIISSGRRTGKTFFSVNLANFLGLLHNKSVAIFVSNYERKRYLEQFIKSKNVRVFSFLSSEQLLGLWYDVIILDEYGEFSHQKAFLDFLIPACEYTIIISSPLDNYFDDLVLKNKQNWWQKLLNKIKRKTLHVNVVITPAPKNLK